MRGGNPRAGWLRVLKAVRRHEPVARTDLVALTGLTAGTITHLTGQFVRQGLLVETRTPVAGMGRPRLALSINPDKTRVVGASVLSDSKAEVVVANLRGDTLLSHTIGWERPRSVEAFADRVAEKVLGIIEESPFSIADIDCVGVALPVVVDSQTGIVHWVQTYPVAPVPVGDILRAWLGKPVFVENTFDVLARAEHWFGAKPTDNFSLIGVGIWLSLSQYVDGALWTGAFGTNSEFAHVKLATDDRRVCTCGATGCLAMSSSVYGIVSQVFAERGAAPTDLAQLDAAFADIVRDLKAGDPLVRDVFDRAATYLGLAVSNHINVSSPERIIMLADGGELLSLLKPKFLQVLEANTLHVFRGRARIEFSTLDERSYVKGAAALALEHLDHFADDGD